jgi:4-amino-4-deoxy-L-arabinose transferase-like glycosyltransferase
MDNDKSKRLLRSDYLLLIGLLFLAILFRLYKLRTAPDWFIDEGEFTRLADYISRGNFDFLGIRNSMLLIGRPPLFVLILAGMIKLFGADIVVVRILSVSCSIFVIIITYCFIRYSIGRKSAFFTTLLLAIIPEYIFYNRLGFSYNWTSLWMTFSIFALWKYLSQYQKRWLVASCLMSGIAFSSDYLGLVSILTIILVSFLFKPKDFWMLFLILIPLVISLAPTFIESPGDAWNNLIFSFSIVKRVEGNIGYQFSLMLQAYPEMFLRQPLIILGIIGIFILSDLRLRGLLLVELIGIIITLSFSKILAMQYLLPIWPIVMIGLGYFIEKIITYIFTVIKSSIINLVKNHKWLNRGSFTLFIGSVGPTLLAFAFVFLPISYMLILDIKGYFVEPVNPSSTIQAVGWSVGYIPASDAEAVAQAILINTKPTDFVIAPGALSWILVCNATDIRIVYRYYQVIHSINNRYLQKDDFLVEDSLSNAKYAVVDNTWRTWAQNSTSDTDLWLDEVSHWPLVMERGSLQLFCNPSFCQ